MSGRSMKFPYTIAAKIDQFPYKFYWQTNWLFKYWHIGVLLSTPFFYWVTKQVNSPEYVAQHIENQKRQKAKDAAARAAGSRLC